MLSLLISSVQAWASDASLQELSIRSGLSRDQLQEFISNCDANQMSMYFCAWNDEIASEQKLKQRLTDKLQNHPACQAKVTKLAKQWLAKENKRCEKSSKEEWSNGSMQPTAHVTCLDQKVQSKITAVEGLKNCNQFQRTFSKNTFR